MATIVPPTTDTQSEGDRTPDNELGHLADFIREHARDDFDRHLAAILAETATTHELWAQECSVSHWHTEVPCDEYERGLTLGIAWIKSLIASRP